MSNNSDPVEAVSVEFRSDTPHGRGSSKTRLLVNGQDITQFCRSFELSAHVDDLVTARIEVLPREGFDLSLPVSVVALAVTAMPGYVLIEEETDGCKRWRVEREPIPEPST